MTAAQRDYLRAAIDARRRELRDELATRRARPRLMPALRVLGTGNRGGACRAVARSIVEELDVGEWEAVA